MKTLLKFLTVMAFMLGIVPRLYSQGILVPNGISSAYNGNQFNLFVKQNPISGNNTGFALNPQGANTFLFNPVLDEGVRTFLVASNDSISLQPIMANSYPELTFPNTYVFANGVPFYLGFYTGETFPHDGIYDDPLFGWARLVNNGGTIQLLDSALEYGGGGIFAGTRNIIPVPEPSTLGLFALGSLLVGLRGWKTSKRRHLE